MKACSDRFEIGSDVWHETKEKIMNEIKFQRHRASFDAWIIQETFKKTLFSGDQFIRDSISGKY